MAELTFRCPSCKRLVNALVEEGTGDLYCPNCFDKLDARDLDPPNQEDLEPFVWEDADPEDDDNWLDDFDDPDPFAEEDDEEEED